jgi:hypothetical protein
MPKKGNRGRGDVRSPPESAAGNLAANAVSIASVSLSSPSRASVITLRGHQSGSDLPRIVALTPAFKLVFLTVTTITILCGVAEIALAAAYVAPTFNQQAAFEAMAFTWKTGIGAIFGLLGGKAT